MINKIIIFLFVVMLVGCSTQQPTVRTTKPPYKKPTAVVVNTPKKPVPTKTETTTKSSTTKTSTTNQNTNQNSQSEILEATTRVKVTTAMVLDYISKYKDVAKSNMKQYGIPSSIILGQGILESGAGTGPLSSLANNHFGIKCHKGWTGPSVKYDDDEAQECFRKYELPN